MSNKRKLLSLSAKKLKHLGMMHDTPDRLSVVSVDPEDVPTRAAPAAQFNALTNAVSINIENLDTEQLLPRTAHEQVHYNLSQDMIGPTTEEFDEELDKILDAREAFRQVADQNGYSLAFYNDRFGTTNSVKMGHIDAIALVTEDAKLLSQVLDEGSPDDGLPLEAISEVEEEDGLFEKHYPSMHERVDELYFSGALPLQEPLAYFVEFHTSGMMDDSLQLAGPQYVTSKFEDRIAEDFPYQHDDYFGDMSMQEAEDAVCEIFENAVNKYNDHRLASYGPAEASREVVPELAEEIKQELGP